MAKHTEARVAVVTNDSGDYLVVKVLEAKNPSGQNLVGGLVHPGSRVDPALGERTSLMNGVKKKTGISIFPYMNEIIYLWPIAVPENDEVIDCVAVPAKATAGELCEPTWSKSGETLNAPEWIKRSDITKRITDFAKDEQIIVELFLKRR